MSDNKKEQSPLVKAVLALDSYFGDLDRLGAKINDLELKSEFDFEQAERMMTRFAECGQGVADEMIKLSTFLNEARVRAEKSAEGVAARADILRAHNSNRQKLLERFRILGEKVREHSEGLARLRRPEGQVISEEERARVSASLADFGSQLRPLIEEAQELRKAAQVSRMKNLEQNADSLTQTLLAIRDKLSSLNLPSQTLN